MSSGASASALQRLVEQLKLEAGVERIKVRAPGTHAPVLPPAGREKRRPAARTGRQRGTRWRRRGLGGARGAAGSAVSQAAAELQQYCMQNACKDALLVGVPAGSNPFREPRSCALL
nr:guanine nucleotide-binding protein G(I)/G(S)/G(O) subunit gamma-10 isoform X1 [Gorilla gorilla gorilla]